MATGLHCNPTPTPRFQSSVHGPRLCWGLLLGVLPHPAAGPAQQHLPTRTCSSLAETLVHPGAGARVSPAVRPSQRCRCLHLLNSAGPTLHSGQLGPQPLPLCVALGHLSFEEARQVSLCSLLSTDLQAGVAAGTSAVMSSLVPLPAPAPQGSAGKDSLTRRCLGWPSIFQNSQTQTWICVWFRECLLSTDRGPARGHTPAVVE